MEIITIDLSKYHKFKLARWWCDFNAWQWPYDYPMPKPTDWDAIPQHINFDRISRTKFNLAGAQIEEIKKHISHDDFLSYWNGPYRKHAGRTRHGR